MKLFYAPAVCSMAAHIVAHELGMSLDLEKVDLKTKRTTGGRDFTGINPKGYVPTLELDDGSLLTENIAILQYLAAQQPHQKLVPAHGSPAFFRLLEWLGFINSEVHKTFTPLWHAEYPAEMHALARETLGKRLTHLDRHLADHRYLLGDTFSLVDAYAFTVVNWATYLKLDTSPYPNLQRYQADIAARPSVRQAMAAEGLLKAA